ncbi:2Fe-2S iron-sulfur cluster-binding protein [Trinickia dinghuensis]|uniref:Naphthalene 1,2-dioxygenase n=1 Tax=Trinickia dinghuensis TaxID=2291023 RepID=A0A3D8K663_9BURK|nr:2Fe-2S iron-sulfur cluster-binding protein [Trinickia dinghuensis]RDV00355.1 naphthalene 1,2-dioxygenase [Trinickia dinghuensis]
MEVSILPLQRTLDVRSGDNLLEALRNHQVPISYSCTAGRCGTCRCRIVSGNVLVTGAAETNRPATDGELVLACQATLVEDCVIEIPEVDEIVVHPSKIIKTTVVGIEDLTHDIKRVRLALSKPFAFSPGQYASLQFSPELVRPYSMAVAAGGDEAEFHIRVVPGGRVTSYVATQLKVGDAVRLSGPLGTAYLRTKTSDPIICIAGGTGLAPILSIVRGMADRGLTHPVDLYFGVRSPRDIYGMAWLDELKARLPSLTVHVVVTSSNEPGPYRTGVVTDAVKHDWDSLKSWRAYIAGAPAMVDASTILLRQKGVLAEHVYADAFYASGV